jgi:hypothetical protein
MMSAKEDGTGKPSIFQDARIFLAGIILGPTLWRWLIRQETTQDLIAQHVGATK